MQDLGSFLLPTITPITSRATCTSGSIWVMTMIECEEKLHEVVPDCIFRNRSVMPLCQFDDVGEVAASTVLHEDVENTSVAVDVSIVISYNVLVMEVFEDVAEARV